LLTIEFVFTLFLLARRSKRNCLAAPGKNEGLDWSDYNANS